MSGKLLPFFLALAAVACGGGAPATSGTPSPEPVDLRGTSWVATGLVVSGDPVPIVAGTTVSVELGEDGSIGGQTGCNSYFGTVTFDGPRLSIGQLGMTEMGCEPALTEQEARVLAVLGRVDTWALDDGVLRLAAGDGSGAIELVEPPPVQDADLFGTLWVLDSIVEGDAVQSVLAGTEVTLQLTGEGAVGGSAGCNTYGGEAAVAPPAISFGPLVSTEMACDPGIMDQETLVLSVLQDVTALGISGELLSLSTEDGRSLVFRAT